MIKSLKLICGLPCLLVLVAQIRSMSHWNGSRRVYDDCYLRQAHLFQRFGFAGFDTDISRDGGGYLAAKLKGIGLATGNGQVRAAISAGNGISAGAVSQGHQVIPLFASATVIVCALALAGIFLARSIQSVLLAGALGCLAMRSDLGGWRVALVMAANLAVNLAFLLRHNALLYHPDLHAFPVELLLCLADGSSRSSGPKPPRAGGRRANMICTFGN